MGGGLEQPGAVGDGVEEACRRHPARCPGIFGHHAGERRLFFGGRALKRRIEYAGIAFGQAAPGKQGVDIGQGPTVEGRSRNVMGREIGRDRTDLGEQAGECPAVALGGDPRRAAGIQPGESDVAAQVSRHAASGAVVMEDRRAIPGTLRGWRYRAHHRHWRRFRWPRGGRSQSSRSGRWRRAIALRGAGERWAGFGRWLPRRRVSRPRWRNRRRDGRGRRRRAGRRSCRRGAAPSGRRQRRCARSPRRRSRNGPRGRCPRTGHRMPDQQEAREQQNPGIECEQHGAEGRSSPRV